jgi:citrate lyase gamma subunit
MATRMQQRRGTAAQWTAANPVLAAGEIGFETDNNRFKIGNGATAWTALDYFANNAALEDLLDGAPEALNTLNELAAAIGDDANFFTTVTTNLSNHTNSTLSVHGITDTNLLATKSYSDSGVTTHADQTLNIHGIPNTEDLITTQEMETYSGTAIGAHNTTLDVHGIADTAELATIEYVDTTIGTATGNYPSLAGVGLAWNEDTEALDVDNTIATTQYADDAIGTHNSDTTNVHGIADTSLLATTAYADSAEADAITAAGTAADTKISTAVAALTKTSVGLANVDNTADADKPVSDDTQDALDLKANLAGPTFTGTVTTDDLIVEGDFTVTGTTTTINATDLSIQDPLIYLASNQYTEDVLDVGFLAATGAPGGTEESHLHSGFFRDASDSKKWKLISNVPHPVGNVVDITNATKETLVVGALEATTVNPSSGVIFSDGTQTKEGVPSRTPIVQKTASYALSTLTHRDSMIEVSSASATTITIPLDSTVNYPIGTTIDILQTNTGQVTIAPVSVSVTVNATPGLKLRTRWSSATLMKRAANTWVVYGDLTA